MKILPVRSTASHASAASVFLQLLAWTLLVAGVFLALLTASSVPTLAPSVLWLSGGMNTTFDWSVFLLILVPIVLVFSLLLCLSELFENTARIARSLEGFRMEEEKEKDGPCQDPAEPPHEHAHAADPPAA